MFGPKWWKIEARGGVGFGLKRPEMANGGTASVWGRRQEKHQNDGFSPHPPGSPRAVVGVGGKWFKKERVVDDGSVGRKGVVGDVRGWGLIVL